MKSDFLYVPRITLLSTPTFAEPDHLTIDWAGPAASDGEQLVEYAGRLCYMSQSNPVKRTTAEYIENIKKQAHGSVLEHANYSLLFEGVSRSLTHELVRHRAGFAYSQLSQRYVDEADCQFVVPPALLKPGNEELLATWKGQMLEARAEYIFASNVLYSGYSDIADKTARRKAAREAARSILPNATETKIVVTANARAWRTMFELRCAEAAEAEIRRCMCAALELLVEEAPSFFNDFEWYRGADGRIAARSSFHKI